MNNGWIKLFRSLINKGYYKKSEYVHLWVHFLLKANHAEETMFINGKEIVIKAGSFVTSRDILSKETNISPSKIERIIKCFKSEQQNEQQSEQVNKQQGEQQSEQQIEQQNLGVCRLITIVNYKRYQGSEQQSEQQSEQADKYRVNSKVNSKSNTNNNIYINNKKVSSNNKVRIKNQRACGKPEKEKDVFGEFQNVFLTKEEYQKLIDKFGEEIAKEKIEELSQGIDSKGYKYKRYYSTILAWDRKNKKESTQRYSKSTKIGGMDALKERVAKNIENGVYTKEEFLVG